MSSLATILLGPVWVSRRRQKKLFAALSELNPATHPEDYARLTEQIKFEEDFVASFTSFAKAQQATRLKQSMSVSSKGILQLLGLTVLIFVAIGLKSCFFG